MAVKRKRKTIKQRKMEARAISMSAGFLLILFSIFGALKLGFLGVMLANVFRFFVGDLYPLLALALAIYGLAALFGLSFKKISTKRAAGLVGLLACVLIYWTAIQFRGELHQNGQFLQVTWAKLFADVKGNTVTQELGGGMLGAVLYTIIHFLVSQVGTYIVVVCGAFFSLLAIFEVPLEALSNFFENCWKKITALGTKRKQRKAKTKRKAPVKTADRAAEKKKNPLFKNALQKFKTTILDEDPAVKNQVKPAATQFEFSEKPNTETVQTELEIEEFQKNKKPQEKNARTPETAEEDSNEPLEFSMQEEDRDYILPPATLLDHAPATDQSNERARIKKNVKVLEETFDSFGVEVSVTKASLGPAVTKYEIQPAVGVKVSKVVSLSDDLALALAAKDLRIEAPIPGKSMIGIEVPNSTVSTVSFRETIEEEPPHPGKVLEVPLGRDISGRIVMADLTKMPHLLIAGSTGSGKSVCINGIITSILMQAKPSEVKLMMIDPKMVELNVYNGIPHLLIPVVTNPRRAAQALQKVVQEMEERYEKFAALGVRNITGYNNEVVKENEAGKPAEKMPFIVVIVDELADLMMVASNQVEDAIIRLAQMARAAGIHMILATQRPSVDVITGIIKANVPSRIAFAVSSGVDSRTIIDSNGAEKLLGRGDMLYLPMGENKPIRVQGAFISDDEVERVVEFITEQRGSDYEENMMLQEEPASEKKDHDRDELFDDAKKMVVEMQTASVSLLQRRFRIGYSRAGRLIDQLEEAGIVGPSEGSKPRKVLIEQLPDEE